MTANTIAKPAAAASTSTTNVENPKDKDVTKEKGYWNTFYSKASIPAVPSQFCVLVSTELSRSTPIVEFGCGNARDSLYFISQGFTVLASDLSKEAIESNQEKINNAADTVAENKGTKFSICDCTDETDVDELIKSARATTGDSDGDGESNIAVYNRFFLHSIDQVQERQFLTFLKKSMIKGDKLYMEYRCDKDEALPKVYGKDHYRRYVKTSEMVQFLESDSDGEEDAFAFEMEYEKTGQGMAKYKHEDPFVSRIIAVKK
eukprot:CAMPEP_0194267540 /NCGR_PEP_ID=MMETSP0169-20130528/2021_1 /TAXON_ID=218684 /ORGANISM="Corethron pennatum, Strain L29A3" /LENGTH=260 /DNA_ID=CAMNT_0039008409 /DNA_START=190 /DNA_END=972 /DNA_ORIENTATION=-